MTLTDVFSIGSRVDFALSGLAKIMLCELVVAGLIVDLGSSKVVMRLPIHNHPILLSHQLILMCFGET